MNYLVKIATLLGATALLAGCDDGPVPEAVGSSVTVGHPGGCDLYRTNVGDASDWVYSTVCPRGMTTTFLLERQGKTSELREVDTVVDTMGEGFEATGHR